MVNPTDDKNEDKIFYKDVETSDYSLVYYSFYTYNKVLSNILYYNLESEFFDAVEIIPGLFLGSISSTYNKKTLQNHGITHIISVIAGYQPPFPNDFYYLVVNALDNTNNNLSSVFKDTNDFIEKAFEENGKILIHCMAGKSRSATIVIAFLMKEFGINFNTSLKTIKYKRPIVEPNESFTNQLKKYYENLYLKKC